MRFRKQKMKREWKIRNSGCALLLAAILLVTAGCTSKSNIGSVEEDYSTEPFSVSSEYEEDEGLYNSWIKKTETEETEPEAEPNEIPQDITESEAKNRVLAEVMRVSGAEDPEVDQTSAAIVDENEDAYLVSINVYENIDGDLEETENTGSMGTEYYRVDKRTGEVRYLTQNSDFR